MKVFYSPRQSVAGNLSFSPSAGKPERLLAQWLERYPVQVVEPQPVSEADFCRAHDPAFVKGILSSRISNGFGNTSPEVAASLPWTTGSLVSAARYVLEHGGAVCSPTSGFHHARYASAHGFCTLNGLMVAAMLLQPRRVAILDCDFHYGDGTDDIIEKLKVETVSHYTTGARECPDPDNFLEELPQILQNLGGEILIYQAGADAHLWDPLGGWMTSVQMRRRDRMVFEFCKERNLPVVWNLAGGYQEDFQAVLDLHHATLEECLRVFHPSKEG